MARKNDMKKLSWEEGVTDLFLAPTQKGELEVLCYEYDHEEIHARCGGRLTYRSGSGLTGRGYIERLADLTPVGLYRVDTKRNDQVFNLEVAPGVSVLMPFASHNRQNPYYDNAVDDYVQPKEPVIDTLGNYPVVIKVDEGRTLIYCSFKENMKQVLKAVLSGEPLEGQPKLLKRTFAKDGREEVVEVKFYNYFGRSFYPWEFLGTWLKDYQVKWDCEEDTAYEEVYNTFSVHKQDGVYYGITWIGGTPYTTKCYGKIDPCEEMTTPLPGWEALDTNMMYKIRENNVHIIGWADYQSEFEKVAKRVAKFFSSADQQAVLAYLEELKPWSKYAEYELNVNKLLFFLDKGKQIAEVRRGIAVKVRRDVVSLVRQFCSEFNDKELVEAIPDDFIIKFEDSLESGNCQPGTQAFVDTYFPGMTQCKAGALKEFADNWNVMRILKYIAIREGFVANAKQMTMPVE